MFWGLPRSEKIAWVYTSREDTIEPEADCPSVMKMVEFSPFLSVEQMILTVLQVRDLQGDLLRRFLGFLPDRVELLAEVLVVNDLVLERLRRSPVACGGNPPPRPSLR